ncbi:MAG: zinc-dependent peptidase [Chitinophagaceae bacterium]|jgi:Mlc titration factor MtfA (ptsG expression regulator)|nr:zinc-dependent peptidase [Chitinophagaceae bacterium]
MRTGIKKRIKKAVKQSLVASSPISHDHILTTDIIRNYSLIIGSRISYFNQLSPVQKLRFIKRVQVFMASKRFHFKGLAEHFEIPVLISASAVQLTFGLQDYKLQQFADIHVLGDAYKIDEEDEYFVGHVEPGSIYLSWQHFLYGYAIADDNINVGLHEMAHALLYNNFYAYYGTDTKYRLNYELFSVTTGPLIAEVITKRKSYLRGYAFRNIQEFWAVSIEAFFENPKELKYYLPDLYRALCNVLNQDPATKNKIITNTYP